MERVRGFRFDLDGGSASYHVHNVYLREFDGEATLRELRSKVQSGLRLGRVDAVRLALIPLTRLGGLPMEVAAEEALGLLRGFGAGNEREGSVLAGTIIGLCHRFLSEQAVRRLIDVARATTPFDDLLAEMEAKGEAKAIIRFLAARVGAPGPALAARILAERDPERLERWIDLAARTASLAEFERQIGTP